MSTDRDLWARALLEIEGGRHWSLEDFRSELGAEGSVVYGWSDSATTPEDPAQLDGFVLYRVVYEEAWVMNLAVRLKGLGKGRALLRSFEAFLRARHPQVSEIGLEVSASNVAAWKLYKSMSFALVGGRKNYYKNGDDARVYKKLLGPFQQS